MLTPSRPPQIEEYDALSPEVQADPHRYYREFQASCPVHYQSRERPPEVFVNEAGVEFEALPGFFQLFAYDDVMAVLQDHRLYSSAQGPGPERLTAPNGVGMLIYADPPAHTAQRSLINKALTPRRVATLEPRVRELATTLLDSFAGAGKAEFIGAYSSKIPGQIFCEMLGVPASTDGTFVRWSENIAASFAGDPEAQQRSIRTMREFAEFFNDQVAQRRAMVERGEKPPDDLITAIVFPADAEKALTDLELILALQILLVGGHDTTRDSLGTGLHALLSHPEQHRLLLERPELLPAAVEEMLRYAAQPRCLFRTNTREVEVGGVQIPPQSKIGVMYGAANRDDATFERADEFDITRDYAKLRRHLTFGAGIHACVGSALARMVMQVSFDLLLARLPNLRLDPDVAPTRKDNLIGSRFGTLPIRWDP